MLAFVVVVQLLCMSDSLPCIMSDSFQQEQKDAVEADAEVCKLTERVWITPIDEKKFHQDVYDNFKAGDKVRIIVLKEGE